VTAVINGSSPWVRRFHRPQGDAQQVVCFPHAGGSASFYFAVSAALSPDVEVFAVQYPGRQDRCAEPPLEDIGTIADRAFESLRHRLRGRPLLFGHSMGAAVAFEVARRMEQAADITPLRLIASGRCAPSQRRNDQIHALDDDRLIEEIRILGGIDARILYDKDLLSIILPAIRSDMRAIENYLASPRAKVNCPISAFIGACDPKVTIDEARRWEEHTRAGFDIHVFSGEHFYLDNWPAAVIERLTEALKPG
jgi:surfactin synthase thioesterase subunit